MRIRIKMMGALRSKLLAGSQGNTAHFELDAGATTSTLLAKLGLSTGQVHLVMVNGKMDHDKSRELDEGDEVTLFPPVAGGSRSNCSCLTVVHRHSSERKSLKNRT